MFINHFPTILAYLREHPSSLSLRGKTRELDNPETIALLEERYTKACVTLAYPVPVSTSPDPVVSLVLQIVHEYTPAHTENIKVEHQQSMQAENIVGALLERYLAERLAPVGWVWCAGDFVRAVDFIRPLETGWAALQVKNRDNSENSSSAAIREGTDIHKWFRTFSRTGATNWNNFPDPQARTTLSEEGFQAFVRQYLAATKAGLQ